VCGKKRDEMNLRNMLKNCTFPLGVTAVKPLPFAPFGFMCPHIAQVSEVLTELDMAEFQEAVVKVLEVFLAACSQCAHFCHPNKVCYYYYYFYYYYYYYYYYY
jgi:hypothetical protein